MEHLEELRVRVFRILGLLTIGMVAAWFVSVEVYYYLENIVESSMPKGVDYQTMITTLPGSFMLRLKLSFYLGLFLTLPFTMLQVWGFVAPGLRSNERRPIKVLAPVSVALFAMGVGSCWLVLPATVYWFGTFTSDFSDTVLMLEAGTMVFLLIKMMLSFGVGFQMPLLVFFLAKQEIITPEAMMKYWRHAIVGVVVASAIITPAGDPLSLAVLSVPLIGLFFLSVFAARWTLKRQRRAEDGDLDDLD